jgi:hypothetical protein
MSGFYFHDIIVKALEINFNKKMKNILIGIAVVILIIAGVMWYQSQRAVVIEPGTNATTTVTTTATTTGPVACTMDAKACPDGSFVGRAGPKCEFTPCPNVNSLITEAEARGIAEKTCIKGGESLNAGTYNELTRTWWFDANLNSGPTNCNPACVVSEETKTAEINWRCTGAIIPKQ